MNIYLDNSSTTQIDPRVAEVMAECYSSTHGNPSSQHQVGQRARHKLEDAREQIAEILNVNITDPNGDQLLFTSGGTESNNLAIFGLLRNNTDRILISSLEHPSVLEVGKFLQDSGKNVSFVDGTSSGIIDLEQLTRFAEDDRCPIQLVALMSGNNETGVLQPVSQAIDILKSHDFNLHVDAVQTIAKVRFDFQQLPISTVSFSAHKFHGPTGIGSLAVRRGVSLNPQVFGGNQQFGLRPGTESVALAVGMAKALQLWDEEQDLRHQTMTHLRDSFEREILMALPQTVVNGKNERLPHISNLSFPGIERQALLLALDFAGIACSTGSACQSGSSEPSSVLIAMKLDQTRISSAIRFSLSAFTKHAEIKEAVSRIIRVLKNLGFPKSGGFSAA